MDWLERELESLGVRTFGDLRISDDGADPGLNSDGGWCHGGRCDAGQLLRLPWDYERYGLDPDEQPVVSAVRASISVPYLFEPFNLRYPGGESLLVMAGSFRNSDRRAFVHGRGAPALADFGVTLIPQLPAGDTKLVPALRGLRLLPRFVSSSRWSRPRWGRDQGYLPAWVRLGDGGRHVRLEPVASRSARCGGASVRERSPGRRSSSSAGHSTGTWSATGRPQSSTFITRRPRSSLQRPERWSRKRSSIPPCRCVR